MWFCHDCAVECGFTDRVVKVVQSRCSTKKCVYEACPPCLKKTEPVTRVIAWRPVFTNHRVSGVVGLSSGAETESEVSKGRDWGLR